MEKEISQDPVAQFGAGMAGAGVVGKVFGLSAIGKTAIFTKAAGALAGTKAGAAVGTALLSNPVTASFVIGGGAVIITAALLNQKFKWW